jgi:hypothetical protein
LAPSVPFCKGDITVEFGVAFQPVFAP